MKKKFSAPMIVFLVHVLICLFLSFDWPFLEGMYMGFVLTFLIAWGLTVPVITACTAIVSVVIRVKKQENLSIWEIISAFIGCVILLIYLASVSGLLKNFALNFIYIFVFVGTLFVWCYWWCKRMKKK